jgi:Uma2 family endonuclease
MVSLESNEPPRRPFTADEVFRMVDTGILAEDEPVELIGGELIVVSPQGPAHPSLTAHLRQLLELAYAGSHHVRDHSPVYGGAQSLPEPDLALTRGVATDYLEALPGPSDVDLVVEISLTNQRLAREKAAIYAAAGYPTYWLLDVPRRRLELRSGLTTDGTYQRTELLAEDATVPLPTLERSLRVTDLLPPLGTSE